jgi:hypothetical protein
MFLLTAIDGRCAVDVSLTAHLNYHEERKTAAKNGWTSLIVSAGKEPDPQ